MPEEAIIIENEEQVATTQVVQKVNPFDDSNWSDTAPTPIINNVEPPASTPEQTQEQVPAETPESLLVKETGWKSWDEVKAAKARLEELEKTQAPTEGIKFTNPESERLYNSFKEGKEDDLYDYLQTKRQLERIEKMDVTKPLEAAEIIKLDLKYKNKDLTSEEIDYLFEERYSVPEKPEQKLEQTDEEYERDVAKWEKALRASEKKMVIDAKLARPELAKYKTEIVLPEIPKATAQPEGPTQEELEAIQKGRDSYLKSLEGGYSAFKGYSIKAKDEEVELPISYEVTDAERKAYKESLQEFDANEYLQNRWFDYNDKTGVVTPKIELMMDDKYLLENKAKIFQKIANEAAAQMKSHLIKQRFNIDLNGGKNNTNVQQPQKTSKEAEVEFIWKNG